VKTKLAFEIETESTVFERGHRKVVVKVEPSGLVSVRLKSMQRTFEIDAASLYCTLVKASVAAGRNGKR
jgi:hypothetical protein